MKKFRVSHKRFGSGYVRKVGSDINGNILILCCWHDSFVGVAGGWYLPGDLELEDKLSFFKRFLLPRLERLTSPQSF